MSPTSYQTAPPRISILAYGPLRVNAARNKIPGRHGYNGDVLRLVVPAALALAAALSAQTAFFPLKDIKPGMRGTGRTIFVGNRIDEFQVEILGVLDNIGPKESIILARLSGGPLEHTGVMQGMSGSPVYIDGKLVGAVALAFPFAKDPIAGIRPIEDMVRTSPALASLPHQQRPLVALADKDLTHLLPKPASATAGEERMVDIATPLSFGGFTRGTLDAFAPQLRALGLEPRQSITWSPACTTDNNAAEIAASPDGNSATPAHCAPSSSCSASSRASVVGVPRRPY